MGTNRHLPRTVSAPYAGALPTHGQPHPTRGSPDAPTNPSPPPYPTIDDPRSSVPPREPPKFTSKNCGGEPGKTASQTVPETRLETRPRSRTPIHAVPAP